MRLGEEGWGCGLVFGEGGKGEGGVAWVGKGSREG